MLSIVSPIVPFPNIAWWALVAANPSVVWDEAEHFKKMTYRNRYYITGPNGLVQLSIPLQNGRNQRCSMRNVTISYKERWAIQHWRTLVSVYNRSPYFSFYATSLEPLLMQPYSRLIDFNMATILWLKAQLPLHFSETSESTYKKDHDKNTIDIRKNFKPGLEKQSSQDNPAYYQLFSERNGFLPNLSLLDMLFSVGPDAVRLLNSGIFL